MSTNAERVRDECLAALQKQSQRAGRIVKAKPPVPRSDKRKRIKEEKDGESEKRRRVKKENDAPDIERAFMAWMCSVALDVFDPGHAKGEGELRALNLFQKQIDAIGTSLEMRLLGMGAEGRAFYDLISLIGRSVERCKVNNPPAGAHDRRMHCCIKKSAEMRRNEVRLVKVHAASPGGTTSTYDFIMHKDWANMFRCWFKIPRVPRKCRKRAQELINSTEKECDPLASATIIATVMTNEKFKKFKTSVKTLLVKRGFDEEELWEGWFK